MESQAPESPTKSIGTRFSRSTPGREVVRECEKDLRAEGLKQRSPGFSRDRGSFDRPLLEALPQVREPNGIIADIRKEPMQVTAEGFRVHGRDPQPPTRRDVRAVGIRNGCGFPQSEHIHQSSSLPAAHRHTGSRKIGGMSDPVFLKNRSDLGEHIPLHWTEVSRFNNVRPHSSHQNRDFAQHGFQPRINAEVCRFHYVRPHAA
jgi:hypothetical protein